MNNPWQNLNQQLAELGPPEPLSLPPAGPSALDPLDLMARARLTAAQAGVQPFTCAIINVKSGRCSEDCAFCAQSGHYNTGLADYPMLGLDQILPQAEEAAEWGCRRLGLVAAGASLGDDDFKALLKTGQALARRLPLELCASIGALTPARAEALKANGFTTSHHNLEAGPNFFPRLCSTHSLGDRVQTVRTAQAAGLRSCCGGLFGLGETWTDRLELLQLLNQLKVDSIPINFLHPIPGTPLAHQPTLPPAEALRLIALTRLLNPTRDIITCGGRQTTLKTLKNMTPAAGANGLMLGPYLTTTGPPARADLAELRALELF